MIEKAATLPADLVFLDLEDSVAPSEKHDSTRQQVVDSLVNLDWHPATRAVRVNAVTTQWCFQDIIYIVSRARDHFDCLIVPKVESAAHVHFVDHLLSQLEALLGPGRSIGLELQIESPKGLVAIESIANASLRTESLIFGPGDFAASQGVPQLSVGAISEQYPGDQWHYVLARIATVGRAFGLQVIDGPYAAIHDQDGFREVARRSAQLGFDGKWAIHPGQITICNEVYAPSQHDYDRAELLIDAYQVAVNTDHRGAVVFEGEMIDEASRKMAEQVAARGRASGLTRS